MIWTVLYRDDASGRQGTLELEAECRGDVFDKMRRRQLRVLNVLEGRLAAQRSERSQRLSLGWRRRIAFWLLFLLVAAGAGCWLARHGGLGHLKDRSNASPAPPGTVSIVPADGASVPAAATDARVTIKPRSSKPLRPKGEK